MKRKLYLYTLTLLLLFSSSGVAQVTIGSLTKPNNAAILELKETEVTGNAANSSRGLGLPRVQLTDKNNLYPMFESFPGSKIPKSEYSNASLKLNEDNRHTGLLVYNTNKCDGFANGIYVWKGNEWEQVTNNPFIPLPEILLNGETQMPAKRTVINIPSGLDLRTFTTAQNMQIGWKSSGLTLTKDNVANTVGGGLSFASNPPSGWPATLSANPTNFAFNLNNMSNVTDIVNRPWQSRETTIKFSTSQDECGASTDRTFVLNQTNYALTVDNHTNIWSPYRNRTSFRQLITLIDSKTFPGWSADYLYFSIRSNATWTSTYQEVTPNIISNIKIPAKGGKEVTNYSVADSRLPSEQPWIYPTRNNLSLRTNSSSDSYVTHRNQYKTAGVLTFYDSIAAPNNRFAPIKVTFIQCAGLPDLSPIEDGDAIAESQWADKVLYHKDQSNNKFYSASFGSAGRWMTTNLAATRYADNMGGANLELYTGDSIYTKTNSSKAYGYPRYIHVNNPQPGDTIRPVGAEGWGLPPVRQTEHGQPWYLEQGLLYTWYAATNQTRTDSQVNQGQLTPGLENPPGMNEVENTGPGGTGNKKYIQGVCPDGWHLPSDREWNMLERELYNNPKKYSQYTDDLIGTFTPATWNPTFETSVNWRGGSTNNNDGYAGVFKEICPVRDYELNFSVYSYGYSKEPAEGGFNVMCVGWGMGNMMHTYSGTTGFWASSSNINGAWTRSFTYDYGKVLRANQHRYMLYSIRCKKNE